MTAKKSNRPVPVLPARRLLRAYAFDPMSTRLLRHGSGKFLTIDISFEPDLRPGPSGRLVQVIDYDATRGQWYLPVDLNDPTILAQRGMQPVHNDPRTHQQIVYAVAMSVIERFERFAGFRMSPGEKLRIVPHAFEGRNAYFDKERQAVLFGYFRADQRSPGANLPGQVIFTCLSVDVVAHEVAHAIMHQVRRYYAESTHADVLAWHEAFADLIALFNHFAYPEVVENAIAKSEGSVEEGSALLQLAAEFGESTGRGAALRSAIDSPATPEAFLKAEEPHVRGACFVAAVFDAFRATYKSQTADLRRLASAGTGILPPGALPTDLIKRFTAAAALCADWYLAMVIRAFEYLPVVDVTFGDVVRAIVTADFALYPDDADQIRATLVEAFRQRGIYPTAANSLADEALIWPKPSLKLSLTRGKKRVKLSSLIYESTLNLDIRSTATQEGGARRSLTSLIRAWGVKHAYELGLDKRRPESIEVVDAKVVYLRASGGYPKPVVVIQFAQRRQDLEERSITEDSAQISQSQSAALRAGTTVIARADGEVEFIVAKPLPLSDSADLKNLSPSRQSCALAFDKAGAERLGWIRDWIDEVEDRDAVAAWTAEPATHRLTFARLHAEQEEVSS